MKCLPHSKGIDIGPLLAFFLPQLLHTTLKGLSEFGHFRVVWQDLGTLRKSGCYISLHLYKMLMRLVNLKLFYDDFSSDILTLKWTLKKK